MRLSIRFLAATAILSVATIAAHADNIAGFTGGTLGAVQVNNPEAASWTQSQSYTGVSISAVLSASSFNGGGTGTVYLTNQIGAGTTAANEIAHTTVSGLAFGQTSLLSLFSGLSLGSGTYYLITASNLGGGGLAWDNFSGNAAVSGITGTNNPDELGFGSVAAYPPASNFFAVDNEFDFQVIGTPASTGAVPEPSSLFLLGTGILSTAEMARRRWLNR